MSGSYTRVLNTLYSDFGAPMELHRQLTFSTRPAVNTELEQFYIHFTYEVGRKILNEVPSRCKKRKVEKSVAFA